MALGDDQRAMLQLLLAGGQTYADIAALLGVDAAEVRSRARRSLTELGGSDPDAEVGLTDYLLGQADPIGRADSARHLQNDPASAALAAKLAAQLRIIAPTARLPQLPGEVGAPQQSVPTPASSPAAPTPTPTAGAEGAGAGAAGATGAAQSALGRISGAVGALGERERRLPVAIAATVLLILVVVLAVTGVFGGGTSSTSSGSQAASQQDKLEVVKLAPVGGGGASGQAVIARVQDQPVLQINITGLKPTTKDQSYIVWLYNSDAVAFPLARQAVGPDGNLTGAAAIPSALISLLPQFKQIDVSLASNTQTQAALQGAAKAKKLPPHSGVSVLRGTIGHIPSSVTQSSTTGTGTGTGTTGATPTKTGP